MFDLFSPSVFTPCPISSPSLFCSSSSMWSELPSNVSPPQPQNEEYCPVAIHNPLTGYEPSQLYNSDYSETSTAIFQNESVDIDTERSYSFDAELDDELNRKALSSPMFIQQREEPANLRQTCHSHKTVGCQLSPFLHAKRKSIATWKASEPAFSLKDKKSKFLLKSDLRFRSTNFKPILTEEVSTNQLELLILSEWKLIILLQGVGNPGEINYYFKKNYSEQNRDLRETRIRYSCVKGR